MNKIQHIEQIFRASILTIALSLLSISVNAQQKIDEKLAASADGTVNIEHVDGKAELIGWDKNEVSVSGTLGEKTKEFTFERDGEAIIIIVKKENNSWESGWNSSKRNGDDLVIHMPKNSQLNYTAVNTDVQLSNVHGGVNAQVVNGDMQANDLSGRISLESVNGDIHANGLKGEVKIDTVNGEVKGQQSGAKELTLGTVNGDIEFVSDSAELSVETVNGDIELQLAQIIDVELNTVNGDMAVTMSLRKGAKVEANSVGGTIDLALNEDVGARFDIQAHAGGEIYNKLTDEKSEKAKYGPREWLAFSTPNATANVDISTVHGTVILRKQ